MFGSNEYDDALVALISTGALIEETVSVSSLSTETVQLFKARASLRKAWSRLSIRSIEPIQYSIVDLSHRDQRGRTDSIVSSAAVLDTLPYSCVFYHAHPGAIVTHRAKKYEIVSMTTPPAFVGENFGCVRGLTLAAFVRPTKARYFTRPLSKTTITIVKQMEMVQLVERRDESNNGVELAVTLAGCGAVNLKRQVRGYKKLSGVNFQTISKTELSLPPIEYDTFGLYICTDSTSLSNVLGDKYGPGVHALSHALLAVAPMFAEGLTRGDLECDHSFFAPTRLVLFDQRAGGSGCSQRLWKHFFQPNNILQAALELLKECTMCRMDSRYDGGCPACLHTSNCSKFNMYMSRSAAIAIGERMLERIKLTEVYQKHAKTEFNESNGKKVEPIQTTPRRKARIQALKQAKEMHSARNRQFVVGRPAWPLDCAEKGQVFG